MDAKPNWIESSQLSSFNPRARDGREKSVLMQAVRLEVSIHAPVMDANTNVGTVIALACFNPRARDGRELTLNGQSRQD